MFEKLYRSNELTAGILNSSELPNPNTTVQGIKKLNEKIYDLIHLGNRFK